MCGGGSVQGAAHAAYLPSKASGGRKMTTETQRVAGARWGRSSDGDDLPTRPASALGNRCRATPPQDVCDCWRTRERPLFRREAEEMKPRRHGDTENEGAIDQPYNLDRCGRPRRERSAGRRPTARRARSANRPEIGPFACRPAVAHIVRRVARQRVPSAASGRVGTSASSPLVPHLASPCLCVSVVNVLPPLAFGRLAPHARRVIGREPGLRTRCDRRHRSKVWG